jgi:hypothetical protein
VLDIILGDGSTTTSFDITFPIEIVLPNSVVLSLDVTPLDLPTPSLILGTPFLSACGRVVIDMANRSIRLFERTPSELLLEDGQKTKSPPVSVSLMSYKEARSFLRKKRLHLGLVRVMDDSSAGHVFYKDDKLHRDIDHLLNEFKDVSSLADSLPPHETDHRHYIHLEPNSTPYNGPIYNMSPMERQELIRQLKNLIEAKKIRPSSSPVRLYYSPRSRMASFASVSTTENTQRDDGERFDAPIGCFVLFLGGR